MKRAKRLVSLCLALVMACAMAATAFAAGPGSITVDNPQKDAKYKAYKIFDVVYSNTEPKNYSYTIQKDSEWFSVVATVNGNTVNSNINGLTFETVAGKDDTYVVKKTDGFSAAAFANTLKANTTDKTGTTLTVAGDKATATGLDLGYYFVTSGEGALCNLTTTNPSVTIHDKNDVPFDKTDDKDSVEVGEKVTYTITGKVPDTTGFTTYTYEIADTMSTGLTFNKDVVVKIGKTVLSATAQAGGTADYTVTYDVDNNANSFKVNIDVMKQQAKVGETITVTYTATVNENAVAKIEKNSATLTYSNDPTDSTKTDKTPPDEETVYSAKIAIVKHKTGDVNTKLAGAKFVLYKDVNGTKMYYKYTAPSTNPAVEAKVEWVDNQADATEVMTVANGAAEFKGLKNGTYYLLETAAPAGYNPLKDPVTVTINNDEDTVKEQALTVTEKVANNTGTELPDTGGMGTTILYTIGGILVVGAGVLLVAKKRMSCDK